MQRNDSAFRYSSILLSVLLAACTGEIAGAGAPSARGSGGGSSTSGGSSGLPPGENPGGVTVSCDVGREPGVSPLLKLSTLQYRNTVRDLLSAVSAKSVAPRIQSLLDSIPDDSLADRFRGLDHRTAIEHVQGYFNVGVAVGDALVEEAALLAEVAGECALEEKLSEACFEEFEEKFLRLAHRRPLTDEERADYEELNDGERSGPEAIRAMVIVALSSPRFVHHVEIDGGEIDDREDLLQLDAYEIASRLSYTFWQTMPDSELWASAESGELATEAGFEQQLSRIFEDPRTRETLWQFWNEWLGFEKFTGFESARPAFQALAEGESFGEPGHDHYADMVQEMRDLTELFTFERGATLASLLTTDVSVTSSPDLARLYGVKPWSGDGAPPRLPAETRGGLLQRAALLVSNLEQTNPFHRGAFLRRHVLCDDLPQPDPNALPPGALDPPPVSDAATTRERFQGKVDGNPLCQGCHGTFSDIGYVLEAFDALGRFRTVERVFDEKTGELLAELPIDATGVVRITEEDDEVVSGPLALNERLVESGKVQACLADHYFRFASRRSADAASLDVCEVRDLAAGLDDSEVGLAGTFRRLAQHPSFFLRKVGPQ